MPKHIRAPHARFAGIIAVALACAALPARAEKSDMIVDPDTRNFSGSYLAGRHAGSSGDAATAATFFRDALASDPDNLALLDRAFVLSLVSGDMQDAVALAARLVAKDSSHLLAQLSLAVEAVKQDRMKDATERLSETGNGPLAELTSTVALAWIGVAQGHADQAITAVEALQGPEWFSIFKPYHVGLIAGVSGQDERAGEAFEAAYAADPGALRIVQAWSRWLAAHERTDEALAVLDAFEARLPNHPLVAEARRIIEAGEVPASLVTSAADGIAELLYGLGSALGSDAAEEYAASYLQLALDLTPNPLARFALADFHERVKDFASAAQSYGAVPEDSPLHVSAEIRRALVLNADEKPEEAQAILRGVLDDDPRSLEALIALGNVLRARQEFAEADELYTSAIELAEERGDENWTLYYFRGIARERTDRWDEAEADLKRALEIEPEQPLVLNYLGYSWIDNGIHLEEGLSMIRRAVEARPNDGFIVDSLGWAYYRLGRYREAVEHLERAVELMPQEAVINDHLGDAYWRAGRKLEATFQWNHALDQDTSEEPGLKDEIRKKLREGLADEAETPAAVASETE